MIEWLEKNSLRLCVWLLVSFAIMADIGITQAIMDVNIVPEHLEELAWGLFANYAVIVALFALITFLTAYWRIAKSLRRIAEDER